MNIPTELKENLLFRVRFHQAAESDSYSAQAAKILFTKSSEAFFLLCGWTYDPRKTPPHRPFIPYPYQSDFVQQLSSKIDKGESLLIEKTRDVGATWMILTEFLRRFLFLDQNLKCGSRKEELVDKIGDMDTHFERLRYIIRKIPTYLLKLCSFSPDNMPYMKIFKASGASIVGESMNEDFSRQGRYNAILLDEFAACDAAEAAWTACGDSSPCKIVVSTPHGNLNKFARLRKSGQIEVISLHWSQHPEKTQAWYEAQCATRSPDDIAQELDINYNISAGKPFYGGFTRAIHLRKTSIIKDRELLRGWDFGYQHPACIICQIDSKGRFLIQDAIFGERETIKQFGERVRDYLHQSYPGMAGRDYGDYAGNQRSDKSEETSIQILERVGFRVVSRPSNTPESNYKARKEIVEGRLAQLIDGLPGIIVNDTLPNQIIVEGFEGGYRYPDPNKSGFIPETPLRDGYYEHVFNGLEYIFINCCTYLPPKQGKSKRVTDVQSYHRRTQFSNAGFRF